MLNIGVLACQGSFAEHLNCLNKAALEINLTINVKEIRSKSDLEEIQGLIIPGGESTTLSVFLSKSSDLGQALKQWCSGSGHVTWGTCAGLIVLADLVQTENEVFEGMEPTWTEGQIGGLAIKARRNGFGRQRESFEASVELCHPLIIANSSPTSKKEVINNNNNTFPGVFIRAPRILSFSPELTVLAKLAEETVSIMAREPNIMATSFHPELTNDLTFHKLFLSLIENKSYK